TVARLHWQPCHFRRLYAGAVDIELLVAEPVSPADRPRHQFSAHDVAVKPVGALPVRHVNHTVIEPRRDHHCFTLSSALAARVRAPTTASSTSRACREAS